jgi:uncharacterized protein YqjF (DUF2071 family)
VESWPSAVLAQVGHRPWPLPAAPWVGLQTWQELLFAHWPLPAAALQRLLPPALELDTFAGEAWIGITPFHLSNVRLRWLPPLPWVSAFAELNVRTYVKSEGKPGVWFFSLDAASRVAVEAARWWYKLPYFFAHMQVRGSPHRVRYASRRADNRARRAELVVEYAAEEGAVRRSTPGSLEHWLTERYCLYAADRHQRLLRAEIHHLPWPLQSAAAEFTTNTMTQPVGIQLPDTQPLLHFARRLDVVVCGVRPVGR